MSARTIRLPWAKPPLSLNDRGHTRHSRYGRVVDEARWTIRAQRHEPITPPVEAVLHWRLPDRRRRDADNLAAVVKAVLDAVVREGLLPDDSWRYVPRIGIELHAPDPARGVAMWLTLTGVEA